MGRQVALRIDDYLCQVCTPCLAAEVCKVRALTKLDIDEPPYIDLYRCNDCRICIAACPFEAVIHKRASS